MKQLLSLSQGLGLACLFTANALAVDLIPFESEWDYMHPTDGVNPSDADADFDSTWLLETAAFNLNYNGPAFGSIPAVSGPPFDSGSGPAPIGYGDVNYIVDNYPGNVANSGYGTVLTLPEEGDRATAYFRHDFVLANDVENLALDIIADDSAVIYIDGVLLQEVNFTGADTWDATAAGNASEGTLQTFDIALGGLSAGPHVLAISLHQSGVNSTDLGFDLRLSDEGVSSAGFGTTNFGGTVTEFNLDGGLNGWNRDGTTGEYLLNNGDGDSLMSEAVDLSAETGVLYTMQVRFDETSVASNFEPDDQFSARLELMLPGNIPQTIQLVPFGLDANADGIVSGDEILPDVAEDLELDVRYAFSAEIPDAAISARVVVEAINDASTERFRFSEALFSDVRTTFQLGSNNTALAQDIALLVGPNAWVEDSPKQFSLNDADADDIFGKVLVSEVIDLSTAGDVSASIDLLAAETSTGSNFEASDTFSAWVLVADATGAGSVIQLVNGGSDTNADHTLNDDEFAPGAEDEERVSASFTLARNLPSGTARAQIFIAAENNSTSETFTISNIVVGAPIIEAASFKIVDVSMAAGTSYDIEFESTAGTTYNLQFSPDLTVGSFANVGLSIVGAAGTTTTNHDPGAISEGFYRIVTGGGVVVAP